MSTTYQRLADADTAYSRCLAFEVPAAATTRAFQTLDAARHDHALETTVDEIDDFGCPGSCAYDAEASEHIADIIPDRTDSAASVVMLRCGHAFRVTPEF